MPVSSKVQCFIDCLNVFERSGETSALLDCFRDDAEAINVRMERPAKGRKGIQAFWSNYRQAFQEIRSSFGNIQESGSLALLEWASRGSLSSNAPIEYRGITMLEFDGEKIRSLRSYFDSAGLHPVAHAAVRRGGLGYAERGDEPVAPASS